MTQDEMTTKLRECNYYVISVVDKDIETIHKAIEELISLIATAKYLQILVYYAGHGLIYKDKHYMEGLEFYHSDIEHHGNRIKVHCISVEDVIEKICKLSVEESKYRSIVVILDTCREITRSSLNINEVLSINSVVNAVRNASRIGVLVGYACARGKLASEMMVLTESIQDIS